MASQMVRASLLVVLGVMIGVWFEKGKNRATFIQKNNVEGVETTYYQNVNFTEDMNSTESIEVAHDLTVNLTADMDMVSFLQSFKIEPIASEDGSLIEFKIVWIEEGSELERQGFKAGDIIESVNGRPISSPSGQGGAIGFLNSLRTERAN